MSETSEYIKIIQLVSHDNCLYALFSDGEIAELQRDPYNEVVHGVARLYGNKVAPSIEALKA